MVGQEPPHRPVMCTRTASAPATSVAPANQRAPPRLLVRRVEPRRQRCKSASVRTRSAARAARGGRREQQEAERDLRDEHGLREREQLAHGGGITPPEPVCRSPTKPAVQVTARTATATHSCAPSRPRPPLPSRPTRFRLGVRSSIGCRFRPPSRNTADRTITIPETDNGTPHTDWLALSESSATSTSAGLTILALHDAATVLDQRLFVVHCLGPWTERQRPSSPAAPHRPGRCAILRKRPLETRENHRHRAGKSRQGLLDSPMTDTTIPRVSP